MFRKIGKHKKKRKKRADDKTYLIYLWGKRSFIFLVLMFLAKNATNTGNHHYSVEEIFSFSFGSTVMIMAALILLVEFIHEY